MDTSATSPSEEVFKTYLDELYENGLQKGIKQGIELGIKQGLEKGQLLMIKTFMLRNPEWTDRRFATTFEVEEALVQQLRNEIQ